MKPVRSRLKIQRIALKTTMGKPQSAPVKLVRQGTGSLWALHSCCCQLLCIFIRLFLHFAWGAPDCEAATVASVINPTLLDVNLSLPDRLSTVQTWALNHLCLLQLTHRLITRGIVRHSRIQLERL